MDGALEATVDFPRLGKGILETSVGITLLDKVCQGNILGCSFLYGRSPNK
jgi:hypothetical protein